MQGRQEPTQRVPESQQHWTTARNSAILNPIPTWHRSGPVAFRHSVPVSAAPIRGISSPHHLSRNHAWRVAAPALHVFVTSPMEGSNVRIWVTVGELRRVATPAFVMVALALSMSAAVAGPLTPVKLRVADKDVALRTPALYDGSEIYLPLDALQALHATYTYGPRDETAIVQAQGGKSEEFALARPGSDSMLPLSAIRALLGVDFQVESGVCRIFRADDRPKRQSAVGVSQPAYVAPARPANPNVQQGAALDGGPARQAAQAQPSAANHPVRAQVAAQTPTAPSGGDTPEPRRPIELPRVLGVTFDSAGPGTARITVHASGKIAAVVVPLRDAFKLAIDLPSSTPASEQHDWEIEHPLVTGIHLMDGVNPGSTRVVVDLAKLVSYHFAQVDGGD